MSSDRDSGGLTGEEHSSQDSPTDQRDVRYNWSRMDLEELASVYWSDIAPKRRREGFDEDHDIPSYEWLTDYGFSGIAYALREHHDLTPRQFFREVVGLGDGSDPDAWDWGIDHQPTVDALDAYLRWQRRRNNRAESTVETHRTRLAKWVRTYRDLHGTDALLSPLQDRQNEIHEMERCFAVLDVFGDELSTNRSKVEYLTVVETWYKFLKRRKRATYNPMLEADDEFPWSDHIEEPDPSALSARQVRRVYDAVESPDEELTVVALAGWGLRPSEVAALHNRHVVLDADDPHLEFADEDRKNGAGEVTLFYGVDALADRIDSLSDRREWDGHLFPSRSSSSGHVSTSTVRRRFKRIAERAGVTVDGDTPTPKMGRRFWYSAYLEAVGEVAQGLEGVAADQGSSSVDVVMRNYLSEDKLRQARRATMREKLGDAFGE